jgi:hypothetical protein
MTDNIVNRLEPNHLDPLGAIQHPRASSVQPLTATSITVCLPICTLPLLE